MRVSALFLLILFGCSTPEEELYTPKGKLRTEIHLLWEDSHPDTYFYHYYYYNADSSIAKVVVKDSYDVISETKFVYSNGLLIEKYIVNETTGVSSPFVQYSYNEQSQLIEEINRNIIKYYYEQEDRLVEKQYWSDYCFQILKYEYDSLISNRIKFEITEEQDQTIYTREYRYNDLGYLVEKYQTSEYSSYHKGVVKKYAYNNKGKLEKLTIFDHWHPSSIIEEISYLYY